MTDAARLPGLLLRSTSSCFGDRVFYVAQGRRYWVRDAAWLGRNGFSWPGDVIDVAPEILYSYANGGTAPLRTGDELGRLANPSSFDLREIAGSSLQGIGMEFGAGANPFPVPLHCRMLYADVLTHDGLESNKYPGQTTLDLVRPHFVTDITSFRGVGDESLDFVVACHVIEHTPDPIRAMKSAWRVLKPGGKLVLVVPDMSRTFDHGRVPTTLDHLILDYREPSRARDREHFVEYYTQAFHIDPALDFDTYVDARHAEDFPIHFHVWEAAAFDELVRWQISSGEVPWSHVWQHGTLPGPENIEFYLVLTK